MTVFSLCFCIILQLYHFFLYTVLVFFFFKLYIFTDQILLITAVSDKCLLFLPKIGWSAKEQLLDSSRRSLRILFLPKKEPVSCFPISIFFSISSCFKMSVIDHIIKQICNLLPGPERAHASHHSWNTIKFLPFSYKNNRYGLTKRSRRFVQRFYSAKSQRENTIGLR